MIRKFNDVEPIADKAYDVFNADGYYLGYCDYYDGEWYCDDKDCNYTTEGTYYSDDESDMLKMIEALIKIQGGE